jgi:hypothetical protein
MKIEGSLPILGFSRGSEIIDYIYMHMHNYIIIKGDLLDCLIQLEAG